MLPNVCEAFFLHRSRNMIQNQRLSFCFCVRGAHRCSQDRDLQSCDLVQNCFVSLKLFLSHREEGHPAASQIASKELGSRRLCLLGLLSGRDQAMLGGCWQAWKRNTQEATNPLSLGCADGCSKEIIWLQSICVYSSFISVLKLFISLQNLCKLTSL